MDARRRLAAELDRVADQVLQQLSQLRVVRFHLRQRIARQLRAAFLQCRPQVDSRTLEYRLQLHRPELPAARADARVGEQVLDELLHARGAIDDVGHEFLGVAFQPVAVALAEQLRVACHHAQRLLQVVRGDVGELLEFGVGARQFVMCFS